METQANFHFTVHESEQGKRLDRFLSDQKELALSRSRIASLIENGLILIDGKTALKSGIKLVSSQKIEVRIPQNKKLELSAVNIGLNILFEDDSIAVIDKPAGISMHPSLTENSPTLVHGLLHQLKSLSSIGGVERPGIVHRIDKGTSGVVVVSKTDQAHQHLARQFKDHSIDRRYLALVCGKLSLKGKSGTIKTFFGRNPKHRKKMTSKLKSGREAITHWKILENYNLGKNSELNLIECKLETGRTHQIRVHLSESGFPIVCDPLYGDGTRVLAIAKRVSKEFCEQLDSINHQLLHAAILEITHPVSGEHMRFESQLPQDFKKVIDLLR